MKKTLGVVRDRYAALKEQKNKKQRKKNRFKVASQDSEDFERLSSPRTSERLTTSTSISSSVDQQANAIQALCKEIYSRVKQKLTEVSEIKKKISVNAKARLQSFKESENATYDKKISKLASEATNGLVEAEKLLREFRNIDTENEQEKKYVFNMEVSLAQEIRQASKSLRQQEKQYFDRIQMYEKGTVNKAIHLSEAERQSMKGFTEEQEMIEESVNTQNKEIQELVRSINKLSVVYKELNQLVIEQGSLIDRIDVNIEATFDHTQKAVVHLEGANQQASSTFADRCMKFLVIAIVIVAIILGFKYSR